MRSQQHPTSFPQPKFDTTSIREATSLGLFQPSLMDQSLDNGPSGRVDWLLLDHHA
jgi:hypothetical protein